MTETQITVLRFGPHRLPRALAGLPVLDTGPDTAPDAAPDAAIDTALEARRVAVVGTRADLAAVLTRLLRTERLDVEVAHVRGWRSARRALREPARRVPLIRDETGTVVAGAALWLPPEGRGAVHGEAVVDDAVVFDGEVAGVRIEPTMTLPGLRAAVLTGGRPRWLSGRAAQLGTTGARVVRDGVPAPREVRRSTFYRHVTGWLRVG